MLRSRALFNAVRAAYPDERIRWRDVWGGYMVGYAVNNMLPLGGGNLAQLFLTRNAIPTSSYPTIATSLWTGVIFDWCIGIVVMIFAFTQGVFPKPPDFSKLPAFDTVGQQIATAVVSGVLGFGALVVIFRFKSFREVIRRGREDRRQEVGKPDLGPARPEPG